MKKIFFVLLIVTAFCSVKLSYAQHKLTIKTLTGVWQYGLPRIGDKLNRSFVFFENGNFYFLNGKLGADLNSTINLKGHMRLDRNKIYFTIISRAVVDSAKIGVVDPQIEFGIFQYFDILPKVITEKYPKEIDDPALITVFTQHHIKINDEDYYKVSSDPNAASKL